MYNKLAKKPNGQYVRKFKTEPKYYIAFVSLKINSISY